MFALLSYLKLSVCLNHDTFRPFHFVVGNSVKGLLFASVFEHPVNRRRIAIPCEFV